MKSHKELTVYKDSIALVAEIYRVTESFPKHELFGLTSQIRRSAVSIPSNISEGAIRQHSKETFQFLYVSLGSASELETQLEISKVLNLIDESQYLDFSNKIDSISKRIQGLIRHQKAKLN